MFRQAANEPPQPGFYIGLSCIPLIFVIHDLATSKDPWLTQLIASYSDRNEEWARRNDVHNEAIQQAANDRNLFLNTKPTGHFQLRYQEYAAYSPYFPQELARCYYIPSSSMSGLTGYLKAIQYWVAA